MNLALVPTWFLPFNFELMSHGGIVARPLARQVFNFDNYDLAQARGGRGSRRGGSQGAREPGSQEAKAELQTPNSVRSGEACQACQADSEHQKRSRIAGLLVHPPGLKIRQGTCTVSGPVLAETRVDDPGGVGGAGTGMP